MGQESKNFAISYDHFLSSYRAKKKVADLLKGKDCEVKFQSVRKLKICDVLSYF